MQQRPLDNYTYEEMLCHGQKLKNCLVQKCFDCKAIKPVESFNKNRSMRSGHSHHCKPCSRQRYLDRKKRNREALGLQH